MQGETLKMAEIYGVGKWKMQNFAVKVQKICAKNELSHQKTLQKSQKTPPKRPKNRNIAQIAPKKQEKINLNLAKAQLMCYHTYMYKLLCRLAPTH